MATEQPHPTNGKEPSPTPKATVVAPVPKKSKAKRAYALLAGLSAAAVGVYFIHGYITRNEVSTDDAEVDADVVPVAARVGGVVLHMGVVDNQKVKARDVIAEIDPAEYTARVAQAQYELDAANDQVEAANQQVGIVKSMSAGGLSSAQAMLQGTGASVRSAEAQVQSAAAALARAKAEQVKADTDFQRAKTLHDEGAVSGQALETATSARDSARAAVDQANANLRAAHDQQALSESRVAEARGHVEQSTSVDDQVAAANAALKHAVDHVNAAKEALKLAKLQVEYATIRAPVTGYVSKLGVHEGQMVQPGMTVVMVVPATSYVVANFKETQIGRIRAGDPVDITVDAFDTTFHGKVDSVSAGTGARFSMMPPDNATGNFVKVVQRVPVKIKWDDGQDLSELHAGLSAEVKVYLQH